MKQNSCLCGMCALKTCSCSYILWERVAVYRCCIEKCNITKFTRVLVPHCLGTFDLLMFFHLLLSPKINAKLPTEQDPENQGLWRITPLSCTLVFPYSLIHSFIYSFIYPPSNDLLGCSSANGRDTKKNKIPSHYVKGVTI